MTWYCHCGKAFENKGGYVQHIQQCPEYQQMMQADPLRRKFNKWVVRLRASSEKGERPIE